jgi:hypothetical protein
MCALESFDNRERMMPAATHDATIFIRYDGTAKLNEIEREAAARTAGGYRSCPEINKISTERSPSEPSIRRCFANVTARRVDLLTAMQRARCALR